MKASFAGCATGEGISFDLSAVFANFRVFAVGEVVGVYLGRIGYLGMKLSSPNSFAHASTGAKREAQADVVWLEALEPRQFLSSDGYTPGGGHDLHLTLNGNGQAVVQEVTKEQLPRKALPSFTWYDSTPHSNMVGLGNFESVITDDYGIWPMNPNGSGPIKGPVASESGVRSLARGVADSGGKLLIIDNETWHFDIRFYPKEQVDKSIADMKQLIGWVRDERPQLKVGVYGYMSQSDDYAASVWSGEIQELGQTPGWYANNMPMFAERVADWQATSEYLRPLADAVDYMFPALYTGTTDMNAWEAIAKNTIQDSRRYGKPVIPFIWPYYHEGIGSALAVTPIPQADWQRQLNVVRQYADGAVIWNHVAVVGNEAWVGTAIAKAAADGASGHSMVAMNAPTTSTLQSISAARPSLFSTLPVEDDQKDHFSSL